MPFRELIDKYGESLTVLDVDGSYICPVDNEKDIRDIPHWEGRDDDIVLACFTRSGTHWLWEIINMIEAEKAERIQGVKQENMIELLTRDSYNALPSPRVLNTHLRYHQIPLDIRKKKCKIVLAIRNPKDVAVSLYNLHQKIKIYRFKGTWKHYVERFTSGLIDYGSWFDYTLGWEKVMEENPDIPIHVVYYEDLKQDGFREIKRLAKFLGKSDDDKLYSDIHDMCQFDRMKREKRQDFVQWKDDKPEFLRKGRVGDWKNWFTVAQNEYFDKIYSKKMANSKLHIRFSESIIK